MLHYIHNELLINDQNLTQKLHYVKRGPYIWD